MNFPAIAFRELRARARHWATYRNRAAAGVVAVAVVVAMLIIGELFSAMKTMGGVMFAILTWLAMSYCLFQGLGSTVDCLSAEKREGTLGLLFLTDLSGFDVVAGKLVARSLNAFYGLLAAFPALAMPFILGGITGGEFWRTLLALLNALFFSLAVGLLVSALGRDEKRVWGAGLGLLAVLVAGLPVAELALAGGDPQRISPLLSLASPLQAFLSSRDEVYSLHPGQYWSALGFAHLSGWLFLVSAGIFTSLYWRETAAGGGPAWLEWLGRLKRRPPHRPKGNAAKWRRTNAPVFWLLTNDALQNQMAWLFFIVGGALVLTFSSVGLKMAPVAWTAVGLFWVLHWCLRIWLAAQACHATASLAASGLMELLLAAPLPPAALANALIKSQQSLFLRPLLALAFWEFIGLSAYAWVVSSENGLIFAFIIWAICLAILYVDLLAVTYVGLWYGLSRRSTAQAVRQTVMHVLILPLLGLVLLPMMLFFCGLGLPVFFLGKSLIFISVTRDKLLFKFREVASQPFASEDIPPWYWPFGRSRKQVIPPPLLPPLTH